VSASPSLTITELDKYTFDPEAAVDPVEMIFEGLLSRGDLVPWIGREKHRKLNLILQFAISAAVGRDFVGFRFAAARPAKVVVLDFESKSSSLKKRLDGIVGAMGLSEAERNLLKSDLKIIEIRRVRKAGRAFPKFPHRSEPNGSKGVCTKFWEELVRLNPADIYIIDPMRPLHAADENDSSIETLLGEMQRIFKDACVVVAHHMRKAGDNACTLEADMRAWSDGARGSTAIKAHSDVIVLQERTVDANGNEVVYLGAFLKDGADVDPFPLVESDHESYFWKRTAQVPARLQDSYDALAAAAGPLDRPKAAAAIKSKTGASKATAYRHIDALVRLGLLAEESGSFRVNRSGAGD
jgi:hypothetical protein